MLFSIIIPIYNVEKYLNRCIDSLINQNFLESEIILIDDCSTDNSLSIAKSYEIYSNVRVISKSQNGGLSETRNIGIMESRGKYLVFIDSDDYVDSNYLFNISSIIKKNNFPDIIYFGYYEEYENISEIKKKYGYVSEKNKLYTGDEFIISELKNRNLFAAVCFGVYDSNFIKKNKLFFENGLFHEDELWTPQVISKSQSIYTSDYCYYHYLRRWGSITVNTHQIENGKDLLYICKKLDRIFSCMDDIKYKKYIYNHIAKLYMYAVNKYNLHNSTYKNKIDRFFPLKKSYFTKDIIKSFIFAINLKLFNCFYKILK